MTAMAIPESLLPNARGDLIGGGRPPILAGALIGGRSGEQTPQGKWMHTPEEPVHRSDARIGGGLRAESNPAEC